MLQRVDLADEITIDRAPELRVEGFAGDTLVRNALEALAAAAAVEPRWAATIDKRVPVAAGLGGGSSDAATALRLANETLTSPLPARALHEIACGLGADVPFFLTEGPQLGTGDGTELSPLELPGDYVAVLVRPRDEVKTSTADVYAAFDARAGVAGYETRKAALLDALASVRTARDLRALPPNDLASSPLSARLLQLGAFRADVSGAGPTVYGLFESRGAAVAALEALEPEMRGFVAVPAWYG